MRMVPLHPSSQRSDQRLTLIAAHSLPLPHLLLLLALQLSCFECRLAARAGPLRGCQAAYFRPGAPLQPNKHSVRHMTASTKYLLQSTCLIDGENPYPFFKPLQRGILSSSSISPRFSSSRRMPTFLSRTLAPHNPPNPHTPYRPYRQPPVPPCSRNHGASPQCQELETLQYDLSGLPGLSGVFKRTAAAAPPGHQ